MLNCFEEIYICMFYHFWTEMGQVVETITSSTYFDVQINGLIQERRNSMLSHVITALYCTYNVFPISNQCSWLSWKSCRSWSEFWEIQTLICKEMCKKLLVPNKSFQSRTDVLALVSNAVSNFSLFSLIMCISDAITKIILRIIHLNLPTYQFWEKSNHTLCHFTFFKNSFCNL